MDNTLELQELNKNIKELTSAIKELSALMKKDTGNQTAITPKSEKDMCNIEEFVATIYSECYTFDALKEALIRREILNADGSLNVNHPQSGNWLVKGEEILGDPEAINQLVISMFDED